MTENLILWELQIIHEAPTKNNGKHTLNLRIMKSTEKFNSSEPIINTTKLGFIRLSAYNSLFYINRGNHQIFYDTQGEAWSEPRI